MNLSIVWGRFTGLFHGKCGGMPGKNGTEKPLLFCNGSAFAFVGPAGGKIFKKVNKGVKKKRLGNDRFKGGCDVAEARGAKRIGNPLSRWHTSPPEAFFLPAFTIDGVRLKKPPAALPGAKLLKSLINRF